MTLTDDIFDMFSDEEITRLNAMFKGMVVYNFGPTRFRNEA